MESYGNDMFLSQEGYASIDFTLLDRPSTSVASAPEFTAPLLPDSSFPSLDFLDGSGIDSLGGVLRNAEEAHFHSHGRPELHKDMDWRKEKALHASSANMYIQGGENPEPKLSSSQLHIPIPQGNFFSPKQSGSDNLQAQLSTSGNRVGDEVHDFFEQEHLSQQQSQLDKANWSVMNNNAWPDDSQNNESRHIQQSSYNTEPNTQPDEGRHSSRMALGVRSPQEGPNNNVMKGVSRNQPLIFDSLVNGSSAGHIRSNQANSAGDGGTPEQNQSSTGSLAGPDTQQGHIVGQGSNHSRNSSEGVENVEARVNYDFLGSQLLLKGQLQAGPQFHGTRLQPGLEEQLWKQFSYQKHLQDLQRQQQIPQVEQHARQQQAQQLEQQARQPQSQQLGQQARQAQAQLVEQQVRRQQVQQFMQQARRQQAQQLEHHARQQQVQLEQQARQHQAQQLQQQARQHQAQQLEHARQQQVQQLEHARQQQAQLLEQHVRQQLEQHARQQQQLEQHSRQQQLQQLLAGDKQNLGNQFSPSPYGSSMHNVPNFMHSGGLMSQMAIESHNPSLLPGTIHQFNAGGMNGMLNCSPSVPGLSTEALLSQDPYLAWQAMTLMGAHLDPSVYGSSTSTMRDAAGQPPNLYPGSQVAVQELADTANKIPSAANHQVGKPVVRTPVLGASALGNSRTSSLDPISAENDGKQKALGKSLFGQSFSQNFTQPSETPQGISNFPQGTTIPRNSQVQDFHLNQHHRSWTEDIGQKENFQEGPSQVLVNSDAPSESGFYNSQPSGWHSVHSSQVVATSDSRIQNTNAGQYVHQGSYQMGNADIFGSLASKPQGSWSALMQSVFAESPSGEADQDDWSSLSLQKTEAASGDYLPLHSNPKQQSVWSEQDVPVSSSMNGRSFNLLNGVNSQLGVQSVQGLQQSGSEVGGHLESKHENIQHNNKKCEDQTYHTRNEVGKDTSASFQHQDPNINSSQNGHIIKQEGFDMGRFPRNPNADNQESNAERYEQATDQDALLASQGEFLNIDQQTLEKQHLNLEIAKLRILLQNERTLKIEQEKMFQSKLDKFKNYLTLDQFKSKALETNKLLSQQLNEFCRRMKVAESLCQQTSSLIDEVITLNSDFNKAENMISDFLSWQDSESWKRANLLKIVKTHKEIVFSEWKHHLIRAEEDTSKAERIMNNVTQMVNDNLYEIKLITDCSPNQLLKVEETHLRWKQEISDKTQQIGQLQEISWDLMLTYLIEPHSQQTAIKILSNAIDCMIIEFSDATYRGQLHKASRPKEVTEMLNICYSREFISINDQVHLAIGRDA